MPVLVSMSTCIAEGCSLCLAKMMEKGSGTGPIVYTTWVAVGRVKVTDEAHINKIYLLNF